jgi:hypothetical protein
VGDGERDIIAAPAARRDWRRQRRRARLLVMRTSLIESPDEHHWVLLDYRIAQLAADASSVRLLAWSLEASLELRLASPFVLHTSAGGERRLDPEQPETLAPLLALLRRPLSSLTITRAGELTLRLGDGTTLAAPASARRDAWDVSGGGALEGMAYRAAGGGPPWAA